MKTSRRSLLTVSFSGLTLALLSRPLTGVVWGAENTAGEPEKFLAEFAMKAFEQLGELLEEGFDVPAISRFVLGRYWRTASDEEKSTFVTLFREYLSQRFAPLFGDYDGKGLIIKRITANSKNPSISWVSSELPLPDGKILNVDWRIQDGDYDILDIKTEQISLVITLREEFASVVQQQGSITGLNNQLRHQLDKGAFRPKS